jgi:superfamily I DNA and RNA helicase
MFDESTLVTSRHMHDLARRLRHAIERRGLPRSSETFTASVAEQVAQLLTSRPYAVTKADTLQDLQDDVAKVEELTAQQYAALRGLFDIPRVAVVGPAGAGKTLLAIWRLRALVAEGRRALFVCFNTDLAAVLRRRNPECADSIASVDKLFRSIVPRAAIPSDHAAKTRFFREELPSLVLDAASAMPAEAKYDAIIVDEGQDFSEEQLIALHELLKGADSQWVFFADWRQDLFRAGNGAAVGADVVFRLHHNCRNTLRVNDATNSYLRQHIDSMPGMPQGATPMVTLCRSREAMARQAWDLAKQWDGGNGVVILSPYRLENSAMAVARKGHGMVLTEDLDDFGRPATVYFSTIRSFKGLEAAGVILIDVGMPADGSALSEEDFYVACTRSTARLAVLTASQEVAQWLSPATMSAPA